MNHVLLLLLAALMLAGCAEPIEDGYVVEKAYHSERTYVMMIMIPMTTTTGNTTTTTFMMIPHFIHEPEYWELTIAKTVEGKTRKRSICTTKDNYNTIREGDQYFVNPASDRDNPGIVKRRATQKEIDEYGVTEEGSPRQFANQLKDGGEG